MQQKPRYRLVELAHGVQSVHSLDHRETFHPVVGPVAEADALYVRQLRLLDRLRVHPAEFVIWDVGLGAAANALTVLKAASKVSCRIRLVSFDHTLEPLEFALAHAASLGYLKGREDHLRQLIRDQRLSFREAALSVEWSLHLGDFPSLVRGWLAGSPAPRPAPPHAILYDAYSPAKNPAMWTQPLFAGLFQLLDPGRPCALPTYSRSTMLRASLLLAGFYVGAGHPTGEKEETTIAANTLELIEEPLGSRWLQRARQSTSAEPLWEPVYRQARLSAEAWERLCSHPQFRGKV